MRDLSALLFEPYQYQGLLPPNSTTTFCLNAQKNHNFKSVNVKGVPEATATLLGKSPLYAGMYDFMRVPLFSFLLTGGL
jgi:hypothetical protein